MNIKRFLEDLFRQIMERILPGGEEAAEAGEAPVALAVNPSDLAEFRQLITVYMRAKSGNDSEATRDARDSVEDVLAGNEVLWSHLPDSIAPDFL